MTIQRLIKLFFIGAAVFSVPFGIEVMRDNWEDQAAEAKEDRVMADLTSDCHTLVKRKARYRSKVDFTETITGQSDGKLTVLGKVDLMNRLGAMIPHNYMCQFNPDTHEMEDDVYLVEEGTI